jgi:hypothetical protein
MLSPRLLKIKIQVKVHKKNLVDEFAKNRFKQKQTNYNTNKLTSKNQTQINNHKCTSLSTIDFLNEILKTNKK